MSSEQEILALLPGARRLDLLHSDGTHLFVFFLDSSPELLRAEGYSGCFDFPEYEYGEEY